MGKSVLGGLGSAVGLVLLVLVPTCAHAAGDKAGARAHRRVLGPHTSSASPLRSVVATVGSTTPSTVADTGSAMGVVLPRVPTGEVLFNFNNTAIRAVIRIMARLTGKNFLIDPRVQGKVTIVSASPVTVSAAYQIFLSALKAQGFTAVIGPGAIVKVMPQANARQGAPVSGTWPTGGDQLVTQVIPISDGAAQKILPLLRPLMSSVGVLSVYAPTNTLIATDYADNIRRLLEIVHRVESGTGALVTVIPLRHVSALDIADLLTRLDEAGIPTPAGVGAANTNTIYVVADTHNNSLLVRTASKRRLHAIERLVRSLDVPGGAAGTTHVVYLRNARADKIAKILRRLLAGEVRGADRRGIVPVAAIAMPGMSRSAVDTSPHGPKVSRVQADNAINALIIDAPDSVYDSLRSVIAKLDIRRSQVFVQALIAEVTTDDEAELGMQWAGVAPVSHSGAVGAVTNFPVTGSGIVSVGANPSTLANAAGLALGYIGRSITLANGQKVMGLAGLVRALRSMSGVNVLATPDLLTLDNTKATIMVGQNVPFITGSYATAGTLGSAAVNPFQTIERKNVGLTLKIKPQITAGNNIKMQIYEEVSSIAPNITGAIDLITNRRELKTTVIVANDRTIVLGGLIDDDVEDTWQGVPLLDAIPLIGNLFRYRQRVKKKTNLMIFLKPVIVRDSQASDGFTASRYAFMQEAEGALKFPHVALLPDDRQPQLAGRYEPFAETSQAAAAKVGPRPGGNHE
ncbi:MAG TPA: type II secretion system secretin GspD [Acidiferrobacter sp.]|nr:type II secretion system secretin GspD [Acidiferrobacter sp.]